MCEQNETVRNKSHFVVHLYKMNVVKTVGVKKACRWIVFQVCELVSNGSTLGSFCAQYDPYECELRWAQRLCIATICSAHLVCSVAWWIRDK